jgi:hypothetical protein
MKKNIILIYFQLNNTFKNIIYHIIKHISIRFKGVHAARGRGKGPLFIFHTKTSKNHTFGLN